MLARDREGLAQATGARAQQPVVGNTASRPHRFEPFGRFERPDQYRARDVDLLTHEVEAPVDPVRAVDVGVAGRPEHRRVARGPSTKAVRGRILVIVRLDLDDHASDAVEEQRRADQLRSDVVHRAGEEVPVHTSLSRFAS